MKPKRDNVTVDSRGRDMGVAKEQSLIGGEYDVVVRDSEPAMKVERVQVGRPIVQGSAGKARSLDKPKSVRAPVLETRG